MTTKHDDDHVERKTATKHEGDTTVHATKTTVHHKEPEQAQPPAKPEQRPVKSTKGTDFVVGSIARPKDGFGIEGIVTAAGTFGFEGGTTSFEDGDSLMIQPNADGEHYDVILHRTKSEAGPGVVGKWTPAEPK